MRNDGKSKSSIVFISANNLRLVAGGVNIIYRLGRAQSVVQYLEDTAMPVCLVHRLLSEEDISLVDECLWNGNRMAMTPGHD